MRAPYELKNSEQMEMRAHVRPASQRMLIRTSTKVWGAPLGATLNRKRAPSRTPAGTRSRIACVVVTSPPPPQMRAPVRPHLATPAAARARAPQRHVERHEGPPERLLRCEHDFG